MGKIHKELENLRYDIQWLRGHLNAVERTIKRREGKKVRHSSKAKDEQRLIQRYGELPTTLATLTYFRDLERSYIQEKIDRVAELKHELDTRLPLTPCGMIYAIVKAKRRRKRQLSQR